MLGDRLPLVGRSALGGGVGFVLATLSAPLWFGVASFARIGFPESAFDGATIAFFALLGAVAGGGLATAFTGPVRRTLMVGQGMLGFAAGGVLAVAAAGDHLGAGDLALAGGAVGLALGLRTPLGVPLGAAVGAAAVPLTFVLPFEVESASGVALAAFVVGTGLTGAALGATVGSCEEAAARGLAWPRFGRWTRRPGGVLGALALLLPAQVAAVVAGPRRDPPSLCVGARRPLPRVLPVGVADLDGDGDLDGLVRPEGAPGLDVLRNDGGGGLSRRPAFALSGAVDTATGDVDGDGDADLVSVVVEPRATPLAPHRWSLVVARNDGRGGFAPGPRTALEEGPATLAVGDLDADGFADVVVTGPDGHALLRSRGDDLEPGPRLPRSAPPAIADLDGDGRNELVTFTRPGDIRLYRNTGESRFEPSVIMPAPSVTDLAVGDLDGDGDHDLAAGGYEEVLLLANDGGGRFSALRTLTGGRENSSLATGDLDGDGDLDLVASEGPRGEDETTGMVSAWENEGDGEWSDADRLGDTLEPVVVGDVTGDGRADVLAREARGGRLDVAEAC